MTTLELIQKLLAAVEADPAVLQMRVMIPEQVFDHREVDSVDIVSLVQNGPVYVPSVVLNRSYRR